MKETDLHIRIDKEVKKALGELCKDTRRNQRQMIEFLIMQEKNK
jgi:predicted transcriptional regulator